MTPGVAITPLNPRGPSLRITIEPRASSDEPDPLTGEIDRAWAALRADNPRLFDGPLLSVTEVDAAANRIRCRRDSFKRLAVQRAEPLAPNVPTGVHHLSVTGAVLGRDRAGAPHVLLGRRGRETRLYGGQWELAPAGGIDAPADGVTELTRADVLRAFAKEAQEELGLELEPGEEAAIPLIVRDEHARSDDLLVVHRLPRAIDPRRPVACAAGDWEYVDTCWLALDDAAAFVARHAEAVIPPTRALLADPWWIEGEP